MKIIELYQKGLSYKEIASIVKCSEYKIWYTLKKNNIKMRGSGNSKPQKINPFVNLTSETLYWLGYICADGNIINTKRNSTLVLYSKNIEILEKYNNFTGNICKISLWNIQNVYGARLHSKMICEFLINSYNIVPNKSLILNPTLPITWDLLRGYFDGDGSIRLSRKSAECKFTTGSKIWAERISKFLILEGIENIIKQKGNAYDVTIYKKQFSKILFYKMYKNANIYLEYKYNRFVALFGDE